MNHSPNPDVVIHEPESIDAIPDWETKKINPTKPEEREKKKQTKTIEGEITFPGSIEETDNKEGSQRFKK